MKVLITGGAGFIGSHTADLLIQKGHEVVIVDNLFTGKKENINKKAKYYDVDICDVKKLSELFKSEKPDGVMHLAAQINARISVKDPKLDKKINIAGTKSVISAAKKIMVRKIIFSSSAAVYGDTHMIPTKESTPLKPLNPYGKNKMEGEELIRKSKIPYVIVRYSNVFGPRQSYEGEGGVVAIFSSNFLKNKPITIYGSGNQTRDFIYVLDVANANVNALLSSFIGTYNISTKRRISINELIEKFLKLSKSKSQVIHGEKVKGDILHSCLDNTKARKVGLIKEITDIDSALKQTIKSM